MKYPQEAYKPNLRGKITFLFLIAFLGLGLMSCSAPKPTTEQVKGKWVAIKKEAYKLGSGEQVGFEIEFFDDKSVSLPLGKGTWAILNDGRVQIDIQNTTMYGELQKDLLTITMPNQQGKVIFKRKKL